MSSRPRSPVSLTSSADPGTPPRERSTIHDPQSHPAAPPRYTIPPVTVPHDDQREPGSKNQGVTRRSLQVTSCTSSSRPRSRHPTQGIHRGYSPHARGSDLSRPGIYRAPFYRAPFYRAPFYRAPFYRARHRVLVTFVIPRGRSGSRPLATVR